MESNQTSAMEAKQASHQEKLPTIEKEKTKVRRDSKPKDRKLSYSEVEQTMTVRSRRKCRALRRQEKEKEGATDRERKKESQRRNSRKRPTQRIIAAGNMTFDTHVRGSNSPEFHVVSSLDATLPVSKQRVIEERKRRNGAI